MMPRSVARIAALWLSVMGFFWPLVALAETDQQAFASQLEAAGFNETDERRHEIEVAHCTMTTYVYEDWEDHGKVLWSSFQFDLRDLQLPDPDAQGRRYHWIEKFTNESGASLMPFSMAKGSFARHEMASRRNPKQPYIPSPRDGVDDYVYKDKTSFFILHAGLKGPDKPDNFISLLEQYRLEFCFPLG